MGLIRSGQTSLTPLDDDRLTDYLWPILREMIKTAIENNQNLILEGCYIPCNWKEDFSPEYPKTVAKIESEEYYIRMMQAWYFATALAKQYDAVLPFIENRVLQKWTHNKAIQKAIESYRITDEQKEHLRKLKIK